MSSLANVAAISSDDEDFDDELDASDDVCSSTLDLFSDGVFAGAHECLVNCKTQHGVDFKSLVASNRFDCFSFFKLVNFIREHKTKPAEVQNVVKERKWDHERYLKPLVADDPLLQLGMDIDDGCFMEEHQSGNDQMPDLQDEAGKAREERVPMVGNWDEMKSVVERLRAELNERDERMELMAEDMNRMRSAAKILVDGGSNEYEPQGLKSVAESRQENEDQSYAGSYAHFGIHHEMLSDRVRTESYRDALNVSAAVSGKSVLDLGCGTGILSMFCARAGASDVTGVDMSDIVHQAMDIVRENGLEDKIRLVKGRLEEVKELQGQKFDVIVSEWMGYFLLFEGMLDSVIDARKKYLKDGGRVLPNRCTMHLVALSDEERYATTVDFWKDVYGFKMSCMKRPSLVEASVEVVPAESAVSQPALIYQLDIEKCEVADTEFDSEFELEIERDCELTAVAGYFDTFFDFEGDKCVMFTTGPHGTRTHWKQTLFYLAEKIKVSRGQVVKGRIEVTRPAEDVRSLKVRLVLDGGAQEFTL